jgi:hypothetical protein
MKLIQTSIAALLLSATSVWATSSEVMLDMIEYIEQNSSYTYSGERLPFVEIREPGEVYLGLMGEPMPEDATVFPAGYFDHNMNTIYISSEPGPYMVEEGFIEIVLFHELVHFLQYENGTYETIECKNALERDAYKLHAQYVDDMGYPEEQKPDPFFAAIVSMCNEHPMDIP